MTTITNKITSANPKINIQSLHDESLDEILFFAKKCKLRDIYLISHDYIRGRVGNRFIQFSKRKLEHSEVERLVKQMAATDNITRVYLGESVNDRYEMYDKNDRNKSSGFRYSLTKYTYPQSVAYNCAIRPIDDIAPTIEFTMLEKDFIEHVESMNSGLILMIGATGQGKTATIASLMRYILEKESNQRIVEYSSPIEYTFHNIKIHESNHIVQHGVSETGSGGDMKTYEMAIQTSMRQAATWYAIGEMTERHSFKAALALANTGHVVSSTVHANSVSSAYSRIYNMFPSDDRSGVINDLINEGEIFASQRLVNRKNGGMIAIREYLIHTNYVKEELKKSASISVTELINAVEKCLTMQGSSFKLQAEKAFQNGYIDSNVLKAFQ